MLLFLLLDEVYGTLTDERVKPLEDFVIGQMIINNTDAVKVKLAIFNHSNPDFTVKWKPNSNGSKMIKWQLPFKWTYNYQLGQIAGYQFGYFYITGSLLEDSTLIDDLVMRLILLVIFLIAIVIFLHPLINKIPKKLFVEPINHFIDLLAKTDGQIKQLKSPLPIELATLEQKIVMLLDQAKEQERNRALIEIGSITRQVAHDLRNYLLGLNQWIENLPNNKDISKDKAYGYIKDIEIMSNNLLNKYKTEVSLTVQDEAYHCVSITSEIVRASTLAQLKCKIAAMTLAIDLPQECYGVFVNINSSLFKRILINLINNAIEAKPKSNAIHIKLGCTDSSVQISINDDGKGIPKNILSKLGKEEVTHGKDDGHGIGLYHATQTVTSWGGKLKVLSEDGHGTTISIILPRTDPPGWFTPYINLSGINKIVIIDDDQNTHDQWKDKLKAIEQISLEHLYNPDQAFTYLSKSLFSDDTLFLVDYQMANYERTGIDIITKSNITSKAILVTGRSDEPEIANACIQHSIHLIPKDDIPLLPLAKYP